MPTAPGTAYGTLVEQIALDGQKAMDRRLAVEQAVALGQPLTLSLQGRQPGDDDLHLTFGSFAKAKPTYAAQMTQPFRVHTPEGIHEGKIGDYLAIGVHGEMYPIDQSVMDESYAPWNHPADEDLRPPDAHVLGFETPADPPLRLKVEGDGSISEVGPGGPLDHVIDTGPTKPKEATA